MTEAPRSDAPPERERSASVTLSRTWELELFISGATVFALLRAPGIVDGWWARSEPHLDGGSHVIAFIAYYYAKLLLYTVISTFVVHLFTRAYWVGLVGLHSVYPGGVRWEELRYGPAFVAEFRRRLPSLEHSIRRVDDVSSLLFAGGAVVMLLFLCSVALVAVLAVIGFAVARVFFDGRHTNLIVAAMLAVITLVPTLARALDARSAGRVDAPPPRRGMRAIAAASYWAGFMPVVGPLSLVISSNLGRRAASAAMFIVMSLIVGTFLVRDVLVEAGAVRADSYFYLPDQPGTLAHLADHYEDRRTPGAVLAQTPAIQSELIRDPYVRLFIPISAQRHNALVAERCPDVPRFRAGLRFVGRAPAAPPPDMAPVIACIAALQPVTLDGEPIAPAFRLTTDAATGLRGIVAHIPVAGLAAGEHVLGVEGLPYPAGGRARAPRPSHALHFWH